MIKFDKQITTMPTIVKKGTAAKGESQAILSTEVKSYANEPYFIKKAEEAKKTLDRVGLPGQKTNK